MKRPRPLASLRRCLLIVACVTLNAQADNPQRTADDSEAAAWFDAADAAAVPQAAEGELVFLPDSFSGTLLRSRNQLTITEHSLEQGWVDLRQCYEGLDAVPDAQVVYRYRQMRKLRIESHTNIGAAVVDRQSVQLSDVGQDASLCIRAEVRILYPESGARFVLRNGPFHRRFLDGYFPLQVTLEVRYPAALLRFTGSTPEPQAGFELTAGAGRLKIDTRFAGTLYTELRFAGNPRLP